MSTTQPDFSNHQHHPLGDNSKFLRDAYEVRPIIGEISIVIPTLGRDILEQCLCMIIMGSTWPGCLIVVEQGSNPKVAAWLKRVQEIGIRVKHICSSQRGRSAGINRGLEQVNTPFVAITDDNCFVGRDWLMNMASRLQLSPDAVVAGYVPADTQLKDWHRVGNSNYYIYVFLEQRELLSSLTICPTHK